MAGSVQQDSDPHPFENAPDLEVKLSKKTFLSHARQEQRASYYPLARPIISWSNYNTPRFLLTPITYNCQGLEAHSLCSRSRHVSSVKDSAHL